MSSVNKLSIFAPRVYRESRGICGKNPHRYEDSSALENLCLAWQEFIRGKRGKQDVQEFGARLMDNIIALHMDLANRTYLHGGYQSFRIHDPKLRHIHKANVRDRLLHHAIYRIIYPFFDRTFIADSFSCRNDKGTHRAINRLRALAYKVSRNHTRTCWVLKCDIRKFFASIDHQILLQILHSYIPDQDILWLLEEVIESFSTLPKDSPLFEKDCPWGGIGLPLGNLTSQLFANVYLNEFDQFVKHKLKVRHYIRYADDFVLLSEDRRWLADMIPTIQAFLRENLHLTLHHDKIILKTVASGMDFLGMVHFSDHRVLRSATKRRMLRWIAHWQPGEFATVESYLGMLKHCNGYRLSQELRRRTLYEECWKYGIMYPR